ncbi:MAG: hypothetical protein CTY28_14520 [Hyphomicrobium sp.]|nr:MAG: hypothetical protein CTY28_14520 [Hyphomicrobium sp.]
MKHAHVDETLTRAEREAPFRLSPPDPALDDGPTRLACVVTETEDGVAVEEMPLAALIAKASNERRNGFSGHARE